MRKLLLFIFILSINSSCTNRFDTLFKGVSNGGLTSNKPYITQGLKSHIIGHQDGSFPDVGNHNQGEMMGLWSHPIKLADGFWLKLTDAVNNNYSFLSVDSMVVYPHKNNFFHTPLLSGIEVVSTQFASDKTEGVVIEYRITNKSGSSRELIIDFYLNTDISPVWYSNASEVYDSPDNVEWDNQLNLFHSKDSLNNWHMVWGSNFTPTSYDINRKKKMQTQGANGVGTIHSNRVKLSKGEDITVRYTIASSINSETEAIARYKELQNNFKEQFNQKRNDYVKILEASALDIPDKKLQECYDWVRINTRWLEMNVEGIGHFLSAGAIEYAWLFGCDNSYALQGSLATGQFELAKSTLKILADVSNKNNNGSGRIIHEINTVGNVSNSGNTQETAHFVMAVWKTYEWTGDIEFLKTLYPTIKKGIEWLTKVSDTNDNLFPEGNGIMEVKGLHAELLDVAVYTQQAVEVVAKAAKLFGDNELYERYTLLSSEMRNKINSEFWNEEQSSYYDFFASSQEAIRVTKDAIDFAKERDLYNLDDVISFYNSQLEILANEPADRIGGRFTNKNWIITIPMETGIAPKERAIVAMDKIRNDNCGEYGPFLSAVERRHMMTISTGVQAVSESNYGRADYAIEYLKMIEKSLGMNMPGAINEMMPNYGCPVQAWTIYGVGTTLVSNIMGIKPSASERKIILKPQLPTNWDRAKITDVKVGDGVISLEIVKSAEGVNYIVHSKGIDWDIRLIPMGDDKEIAIKPNDKLLIK
ncbi:MAG: GH116 family glycosyl hydrolase [Rikenellaceae bacterium]